MQPSAKACKHCYSNWLASYNSDGVHLSMHGGPPPQLGHNLPGQQQQQQDMSSA